MENEKLKNIDEMMKASDIVELLEQRREFAENKLKALNGILAVDQSLTAVKLALKWIEDELERLEGCST